MTAVLQGNWTAARMLPHARVLPHTPVYCSALCTLLLHSCPPYRQRRLPRFKFTAELPLPHVRHLACRTNPAGSLCLEPGTNISSASPMSPRLSSRQPVPGV